MNALDMLAQLRDFVNEDTAAHWSDVGMVRRLNAGQRRVEKLVAEYFNQWLIKRATLTASSGVLTLPVDCAKPVYIEEVDSERPIPWLDGGLIVRSVSRETSEAYPLALTVEINKADYGEQVYLWYQRRVPDLHAGIAASGTGASALVLAADRNRILVDDYYNGVTVEVVDAISGAVDIRSEVSDYVASTGTLTITGTAAAADTYGTISELPVETHDLIVLEAVVLAMMKPSSTPDVEARKFIVAERNQERSKLESWLATRVVGQGGVVITEMEY